MAHEEQATEAPARPKRRRGRSPSYPAIDLNAAIERARVLFANEGTHPAAIDVILKHWDYSPGSGAGTAAIAALKKFGLMVDEGSGANRRARLTELAKAIVLDDPDQQRHWARIREAALKPAIHAELWGKWGGTPPSESAQLWELQNDRAFTRGGAEAFIEEFRLTREFAGLTGDTGNLPSDEPSLEDTSQMTSQPLTQPGISDVGASVSDRVVSPQGGTAAPAPQAAATRTFQIPLPDRDEVATLTVPFPLSEESWTFLTGLVAAMKPGVVRRERQSDD